MTCLEKIKILGMTFFERVTHSDEVLGSFLEDRGVASAETCSSTNLRLVKLAYSDVLESYITGHLDYKQGEISEVININALQEQIKTIRMENVETEWEI